MRDGYEGVGEGRLVRQQAVARSTVVLEADRETGALLARGPALANDAADDGLVALHEEAGDIAVEVQLGAIRHRVVGAEYAIWTVVRAEREVGRGIDARIDHPVAGTDGEVVLRAPA